MSNRGQLEKQTTKVGNLLKASQELSKSGIFGVTIIAHPTEGLIVSGEEEMSKEVRKLLETSNLTKVIAEGQQASGTVVNHFSTRMEKTKLLQRLYKCSLPPLPMPFSEMDTFVLMLPQLNSVVESETSGTKFKVGAFAYRYTNVQIHNTHVNHRYNGISSKTILYSGGRSNF